MDSIPFSDPVKPGSLENPTSEKKWIINPEWEKLGPKADVHFTAPELKADREAIRKTLREQRNRRGIKVSKSVLP